jgi:integrase
VISMVSTDTYQDAHLARDGNIMLYHRKGAKRPIWNARIKRPGKHKIKNRYLWQSMGTTNFAEALAEAEDLYDEMRFNFRKGKSVVTELTVAQLYKQWSDTVGKRKNEKRRETIRKAYDSYLLPFFGKTKLTSIKPTLLNEFWEWRLTYWTKGEGSKTNSSFVGTTPRLSTIKQERQSFKQVLNWAVEQELLDKMPVIKLPELASTEEDDKKETPAFTWKQWKTLDHFFKKEYLPRKDEDIKEFWARNPKLNTSHLYGRYMLAYFMRIGVSSGCRPHELLLLKWKNVEHYKSDGEYHVALNIPKNTKTGARQNVCQPSCITYLKGLKAVSKFTSDEDFLFNTEKGTKAPSPNHKLKRVLKKVGFETDIFGNAFVPYTTRHTHITARLLFGDVSIDVLARNLGTSKEMITDTYDHVVNIMKTSEITSVRSRK